MFRSSKTAIVALSTTVLLLLGVAGGSFGAQAGFTAGVNNTKNTLATGTAFLTAKDSGGTTDCTSVPSGSTIPAQTAFPCVGTLVPTTTTAAAGGTAGTATTNTTATGTSDFTSASLRANSCAPAAFANTGTNTTNPLLVRGTVGYGATGPLSGSTATTFDGSTAVGTAVTSSNGNLAVNQTYSISAWFKTTVKGGAIISWNTSSDYQAPGSYDRHIYLDANGYVTFGAYPGGIQQVTVNNKSYADGLWHFVVATANAATNSSSLTIRVDNGTTVTKALTSSTTSEGSTGYWRVGNGNQNNGGWTSGTNAFFTGQIADVAVFPTALTAAQNATLFNSGTQATYVSRAQGLSANQIWELDEDGTTTYTGTLPGNSGNPCTHVRVNASYNEGCLYPNTAAACPALSSTYDFSTMVAAGTLPINATTRSEALIFRTTRDSDYVTFDTNLHLVVPMTLTATGWTQTFTWTKNESMI